MIFISFSNRKYAFIDSLSPVIESHYDIVLLVTPAYVGAIKSWEQKMGRRNKFGLNLSLFHEYIEHRTSS